MYIDIITPIQTKLVTWSLERAELRGVYMLYMSAYAFVSVCNCSPHSGNLRKGKMLILCLIDVHSSVGAYTHLLCSENLVDDGSDN